MSRVDEIRLALWILPLSQVFRVQECQISNYRYLDVTQQRAIFEGQVLSSVGIRLFVVVSHSFEFSTLQQQFITYR
jgi:hypothetical protein